MTRLLDLADTAGEPLWSMVPKAVAPLITALLAAAVAIAGYFKFLHGRIFKPRLSLELTGAIVRLAGSSALDARIAIENCGQSAVVLDYDRCYRETLSVFLCDDFVWNDARKHEDGVVLWYDREKPHRQLDVLKSPGFEGFVEPRFVGNESGRRLQRRLDRRIDRPPPREGYVLEPGEKWRVAHLVPVAPGHAYLLKLTINACRHASWTGSFRHRGCLNHNVEPNTWTTTSIICLGDQRTESRRLTKWLTGEYRDRPHASGSGVAQRVITRCGPADSPGGAQTIH